MASAAAEGLSYVIVPPIEGVVADKLLWAVNALSDGIDALEDHLVNEIDLSPDIASLMVGAVSTGASIASLSAVSPAVGALVSVLLVDAILAFDGFGQITIAVPNTVWVEFEQERNLQTNRWLDGFSLFEGYSEFTLVDEREARLTTESVVFRIEALKIVTETTISHLLPGSGIVFAAVNLALLSAEYASVWFEEDYPAPSDSLFSPRYRNCTTLIQVPWNFWMAPYRGVMTQIPMKLTGDEYIAIVGDFTTISTWKHLANINIPFVRERGFFEIGDALGTGKEPPPCESSQFPQ